MLDIRGIMTAMPPSTTPTSDIVELVGALRLPLGGVNGYKHVRGKQGRAKDLFQGTTPRKSRRTALFGTAREAAIALAELKEQQPDRVSTTRSSYSTSHRLRLPRRAAFEVGDRWQLPSCSHRACTLARR